MTEAELKKEISAGEISGLYYLYGDELYLRDYYAQKLRDKVLDEAFACFNLHIYDEHTFTKEEISDAVMSYPMMADKKVIMFRDTGILKKGEPDKEFFAELFKEIPEHCVVILCESEADKVYAPYKAVMKYGKCVDFSYRSVNELKTWLAKGAARFKKSISSQDAIYMAEHCGPSMNTLRSEFDKVIAYVGNRPTITREDINQTVSFSDSYKIYALTDAIIRSRADQAFKILSEFYSQKESKESEVQSAVVLVSAVGNFYSDILKAHLLLSDGMSISETVAAIAGPRFASEKKVEFARKVSKEYLQFAILTLKEADRRIKSGEMTEWNAITVAIGEIISGGHK